MKIPLNKSQLYTMVRKRVTETVVSPVSDVLNSPKKRKVDPHLALFPKSQANVQVPQEFLSKHLPAAQEAIKHIISVDSNLLSILTTSPIVIYSNVQEERTIQYHFSKLGSTILGQQISGKVAAAMKMKIIDHYGHGSFPSAEEILNSSDEDLRGCGLSARKVEYIKSLAEWFNNQSDEAITKLFTESNDLIEQELIKIKGIGPWTIRMFLFTSLLRMDVFTTGDLGIMKGVTQYLNRSPDMMSRVKETVPVIPKKKGKTDPKVVCPEYAEALSEMFKPHRSILMILMWRMSDTNLDAMIKNEQEFSKR